jgi:hypothetical protein
MEETGKRQEGRVERKKKRINSKVKLFPVHNIKACGRSTV